MTRTKPRHPHQKAKDLRNRFLKRKGERMQIKEDDGQLTRGEIDGLFTMFKKAKPR